jgi:hypothetical protein
VVLSRQRDEEGKGDGSASFWPMLTLSPAQPSSDPHNPTSAALVERRRNLAVGIGVEWL